MGIGAHLHSIQHLPERPGDLDPRHHGVHGCGGRARLCPVVAAASTGTGTGSSASASTSVAKCVKMHPKQMGKPTNGHITAKCEHQERVISPTVCGFLCRLQSAHSPQKGGACVIAGVYTLPAPPYTAHPTTHRRSFDASAARMTLLTVSDVAAGRELRRLGSPPGEDPLGVNRAASASMSWMIEKQLSSWVDTLCVPRRSASNDADRQTHTLTTHQKELHPSPSTRKLPH
jgi:hypothetical protein